MSQSNRLEIGQYMAKRLGSIDPSKFPNEEFELYSIPAYDSRKPEQVRGSEIGSTKQIVQPGDLLLSKIVPHIRRAWIVGPSTGKRIVASGEWIVFRDNGVLPQYLRHVVMSNRFHSEFMATVSGVGGSLMRARPSFVAKIKVPVPSKEEQTIIARRLDKIESVQAIRRKTISLNNEYLRSLFIEVFGDPLKNPKNWPKKKFKSVAEIKTGNTPSRDKLKYYGDHIEWIKSDNLNTPFHFATKAKEFLSKEGANVGRIVPPKSILVTCIAGSKECIGNAAIVDRSVAFNQQINSITCRDELVPEFVYLFILVGKKIIQSASTNSMKGMVSKGSFEEIEIYVPPKKLQTDFALKFYQCNKLKTDMEKSLSELNTLFQSILAESFSLEATT